MGKNIKTIAHAYAFLALFGSILIARNNAQASDPTWGRSTSTNAAASGTSNAAACTAFDARVKEIKTTVNGSYIKTLDEIHTKDAFGAKADLDIRAKRSEAAINLDANFKILKGLAECKCTPTTPSPPDKVNISNCGDEIVNGNNKDSILAKSYLDDAANRAEIAFKNAATKVTALDKQLTDATANHKANAQQLGKDDADARAKAQEREEKKIDVASISGDCAVSGMINDAEYGSKCRDTQKVVDRANAIAVGTDAVTQQGLQIQQQFKGSGDGTITGGLERAGDAMKDGATATQISTVGNFGAMAMQIAHAKKLKAARSQMSGNLTLDERAKEPKDGEESESKSAQIERNGWGEKGKITNINDAKYGMDEGTVESDHGYARLTGNKDADSVSRKFKLNTHQFEDKVTREAAMAKVLEHCRTKVGDIDSSGNTGVKNSVISMKVGKHTAEIKDVPTNQKDCLDNAETLAGRLMEEVRGFREGEEGVNESFKANVNAVRERSYEELSAKIKQAEGEAMFQGIQAAGKMANAMLMNSAASNLDEAAKTMSKAPDPWKWDLDEFPAAPPATGGSNNPILGSGGQSSADSTTQTAETDFPTQPTDPSEPGVGIDGLSQDDKGPQGPQAGKFTSAGGTLGGAGGGGGGGVGSRTSAGERDPGEPQAQMAGMGKPIADRYGEGAGRGNNNGGSGATGGPDLSAMLAQLMGKDKDKAGGGILEFGGRKPTAEASSGGINGSGRRIWDIISDGYARAAKEGRVEYSGNRGVIK